MTFTVNDPFGIDTDSYNTYSLNLLYVSLQSTEMSLPELSEKFNFALPDDDERKNTLTLYDPALNCELEVNVALCPAVALSTQK